MKIKLTPASSINDKRDSSYHSNIPNKDDELLAKAYALLSIIKAITVNIEVTRCPTISEFSALTYILQTAINNINSLSNSYVTKLKLDQEWLGIDRLTAAHTINMRDYYQHNKEAIMPTIRALFGEQNIYDLIESHLKQPHLEYLLRKVSVEGTIAPLAKSESLLQVSSFRLPINKLADQNNIDQDDLNSFIYYHMKLMHSLVKEASNLNALNFYGTQAFIINLYQVLGNLFKLKYNKMGGEDWEGASLSLDYLLLRNLYATQKSYIQLIIRT